jgi:hypothetical protein
MTRLVATWFTPEGIADPSRGSRGAKEALRTAIVSSTGTSKRR